MTSEYIGRKKTFVSMVKITGKSNDLWTNALYWCNFPELFCDNLGRFYRNTPNKRCEIFRLVFIDRLAFYQELMDTMLLKSKKNREHYLHIRPDQDVWKVTVNVCQNSVSQTQYYFVSIVEKATQLVTEVLQ